MPYIDKDRRHDLATGATFPQTAGELNFAITTICLAYLGDQLAEQRALRYAQLNDVIGVLESAKLEFYRRLVAEFEDTKIQKNGDVGYQGLLK